MAFSISIICLIFILIGKVKAGNYYVAAPSSLRLNSDEVIGIASDGNIRGPVNIYVQDHPGKVKNITQTTVNVDPGKPQLSKIRLDTENFPSGFLSHPGGPKYVSLTADFPGYKKELLIPINEKYGYMFIQTDKPIYTPKENVSLRIIPLNEDSLPSNEKFQLQIRNPNNSIVEQELFDGKKRADLKKVFATHVYRFPTYPVFGKWSATVQYGYDLKQNSTVHFQLQEYVLPMFAVEIRTPDVILPMDDVINITVSAKYVYGKKVQGVVSFRLGVKKPKASETTFFKTIRSNKLVDGFFNLRINSTSLKANEKVGWFPEIRNSHFVVEAVVLDTATGNEEEVVDSKCLFTDTPFSISFKRCLDDFRPGHTSIIEADITYINGEPAGDVFTRIEARADTGQLIEIKQSSTKSDTEGKVSFEVRSELHYKTINVKLTAIDKHFQAEAAFKQYAFQSDTESYIALDRMSQTLKPNDIFRRIIHYEPSVLKNIYYLVTNKGRIVLMNKLPEGKYGDQHVSFTITYEMVPSFRILVFAHHDGHLLVDSLNIDVGNECNPKAEVSIHSEYSVKEPGRDGKIIIRGSEGTSVGLLGVDEAVYALSKKDILTKAKIFKRLASHDLGCGAGGGLTVGDVLGKAGIILGTNIYSPSHAYSCVESKRKRRKRAVSENIVEMYKGFEKECCKLGLEHDIYNRKCEERATIEEHYLKDEEHVNCSKTFLDCCLHRERTGLRKPPCPSDKFMCANGDCIRLMFRCDGYNDCQDSSDEKDCRKTCPSGKFMCDNGFCIDLNRKCDGHKDCRDSSDEKDCPVEYNRNIEDNIGPNPIDENIGLSSIDSELDDDDIENELIQRDYFPETWIFQDVIIGPNNREEVSSTLPHSITTWVVQAISVSPTHGICIAEPTKIVTFQKIFLHLNLPYSVVRNEQVEIQATVFNYDQRPIRAVVYMYGAEGLCSSTQPGEKSKEQIVTVEGESAATVAFPVMPLKAEVIPIRVVAKSYFGSDVIVRELNVVPEGMTKVINIPITLDPTNLQKRQKRFIQSAPYITDFIDPTQNTQATTVKLDLCLPEDFVPGTESCSVSAIGDIFGPAVQTAINNPEDLLIQPGGCGEQNMKKLAPTLYAIRYLKVTGKLTPESEDKGYKYMRKGYDNQLKYRKEDGSYAAFPNRPTSTWLTAFVMKVFCQASGLIYIDENVLCSGIRWLIDNQQHDGSFVENYSLYEPKLMGGVNGKVPLTAFVLIALEECKCSQYEERLTMAKRRAVSYLEDNFGSVNLPLSSAIVAYSLALSGDSLAWVANDKLLKLAKYDEDTNRMSWETEDSAHDIQTAGYALLTQLLFYDMQKSASIVNWLNTKQLKSGAYESTQDTMIALQAMSEYAIKAQVPPINLVTRISSSDDRFSERVLAFIDQNAQVLQDIKINKVGGTLLINTTGVGTGSLSVTVRCNVIVPPEDICKFDIEVNVTDTKHEEQMDNLRSLLLSGNDFRVSETAENSKLKYRISICVRYLGDKDSDMSIVDVGIFSGFQPVKEDLLKIESDVFQLIQKVEMSKRGVIFYLSKIPYSDKYCFDFRVFRQFIVGNTQMSYIKVYDFYNPEATCTKSYKPINNSPVIQTICEGGICQCAEGGCPSGTPFADMEDMKDTAERRNLLKNMFCDDFDYVWKGKLHYIRKEGAFFNISFLVEEVIKAGIETPQLIEQERRTLLARDNCMTAALRDGVTYLILGKDGQGYMNEYGHIWYRYMLDQTSIIQKWVTNLEELTTTKSRQLQTDLNYVADKLKNEGCDV